MDVESLSTHFPQVISADDDPSLPTFTLRTVILGIGLSAFTSVLATIYTFKPQAASVSQLFCLIIAYVLGTAMHSTLRSLLNAFS